MIGRSICLLLWLPLFLFPAPAAAQTSAELNKLRAESETDILREIRDLPTLGLRQPQDVISFDVHNGLIFPQTNLTELDPGYQSVEMIGVPGWARVQMLGRHFQFIHRQVGEGNVLEIRTEIDTTPLSVQITQWHQWPGDGVQSVQIIQSTQPGPQAVTLYVQVVAPRVRNTHARYVGSSLSEIARQNRLVIDTYVRPIFRLLGQEQTVFAVDPRGAYQVLVNQWHTDPAMAAQVNADITGLDADSFSDRQTALSRLQSLGEPAALFLMRQRPTGLSSEQSMRVDMFLAPFRPFSENDVGLLRNNPDFLLDCLFLDDATIHRMALVELGHLLGSGIHLDEHLSGPALAEAVAPLRQLQDGSSTRP